MESAVSNKSYYSISCGSLLRVATPSTSLEEQHNALLRQQGIDIYNLRPRSAPEAVNMSKQDASRAVTAVITASPKRTRPKSTGRSRTAYSKRLLVNARERDRMKILNKGFENLRNALPCYIADGHISKITTLRLAINYIRTLSDVLKDTKTNDEDFSRPHKLDLRSIAEPLVMNAYGNAVALKMEYGLPFRAASNALPCSDVSSAHHACLEMDTATTGTIIDGEYSRTVFEKN